MQIHIFPTDNKVVLKNLTADSPHMNYYLSKEEIMCKLKLETE